MPGPCCLLAWLLLWAQPCLMEPALGICFPSRWHSSTRRLCIRGQELVHRELFVAPGSALSPGPRIGGEGTPPTSDNTVLSPQLQESVRCFGRSVGTRQAKAVQLGPYSGNPAPFLQPSLPPRQALLGEGTQLTFDLFKCKLSRTERESFLSLESVAFLYLSP